MDSDFLGSLQLLPYDFVPEGFEACEGQSFPTGYKALFDLIGTKYGGDGKEEFAVPNLSKAAPIAGLTYVIAMNGNPPK
jgi:microcystin-dependent protein